MTGFIVLLCALAMVAYNEMAANVLNNLPVSAKYPPDLKILLQSLNSTSFTRLSSTDFIYKNYFSFYAVFMVLIAVDIFSTDKENGTMKFTILCGIRPEQIYFGKILTAFLTAAVITLFNFTAALAFGLFSVGGSFQMSDLMGVFAIYIAASVPGTVIGILVSILSFLRINSKVLTGIGLLAVFTLGIIDSSNNAHILFSPIGLLSTFGNNIPNINANFIYNFIIEIAYIILLSTALFTVVKKSDYFD
jgi:ABC-type transport system involved in multi-copper enzyme maturation permease subunit